MCTGPMSWLVPTSSPPTATLSCHFTWGRRRLRHGVQSWRRCRADWHGLWWTVKGRTSALLLLLPVLRPLNPLFHDPQQPQRQQRQRRRQRCWWLAPCPPFVAPTGPSGLTLTLPAPSSLLWWGLFTPMWTSGWPRRELLVVR